MPIRTRINSAAVSVTRWLASERGFYIIVGCFILQALWFAGSARYPMAFDENFHFGLIQRHASQWLPFFTHQPPNSQSYGAVARDPSYLFHYLMSLPYTVVRVFSADLFVQVVALRLINVALFAGSFFLFRRLLFILGSSRAMAHAILLFFSLIPVVPFLAAQINYDNLLIPLMLWSLLATFDWLEALKQKRISAPRTILLCSIMLLTCLVKYVFLPIMAILLGIMLWRAFLERKASQKLWKDFVASFRRAGVSGMIGLGLIAIVSCGLFAERYVINVMRYHSPTPECEKILRIDECLEYGPWQRDYAFAKIKPGHFKPDLRDYANIWIYWMWRRLFFAISYQNENSKPLPLPWHATAYVAIAGTGMFLGYSLSLLRKQPYRRYILSIILVYTAALFAQTWHAYSRTAQPVAINGRYLIPFIPFMILFAGLGFRDFLRKGQILKPIATVVLLLFMLEGGGVLTFIVQGDYRWDWQNRVVITANNAARDVLHPLLYGSYRWDP